MFELKNLYNMLKPAENADLITDYEVIIGQIRYSAPFIKGVIVLSLVNSQVLTSSAKHFNAEGDFIGISESSYIQQNFQLDVYKLNDENATEIQAFSEALKLQEWLKGFYVREYLQGFESEILPNYANINFTAEMVDGVLVNRAFFDFSIISKITINEKSEGGFAKVEFKDKGENGSLILQ